MGRRLGRRRGGSPILAAILIIVGILLLLDNLNITSGIDWNIVWPLLLVLIGAALLVSRVRE